MTELKTNTRLKQFIERIERLEQDKVDIASDIKDIYAEIKNLGYDQKAIRYMIRQRKKTAEKRKEEAALIGTYAAELGEQIEMGF